MEYGNLLLSKIIDENNIQALTKFGITAKDLPTEGDRQTLRFIADYAEANRGQAPSYAVVTAECPTFEYTPQVGDSYDFLAKEIKAFSAKQALLEYVQGRFTAEFNSERDGNKILDDLISEAQSIRMRTSVLTKVGTDIKRDGDKFHAEYGRRKSGESFRIWKSKFNFINDRIGGYVSSNVYTVYGKSGRGKSVITLEEALEAACQGANVLIWAMEMGWFEVLVRIYVSLSARQGITTANMDGINLAAGFDSSELRYGKLSEEFEEAFVTFVDSLNEFIPGNITVRGVDDDDFSNRSLKALESDILQTKADVVVVDPFYYLDYEKNTSKTTGGDAANTSMKLRRLAGQTKTVIFAITQADEVSEDKNDDGNRELKLPERKDVKKTSALLEDAYLLIGVDTDGEQGRGIIGLNKGRDGGEGLVGEIVYIPQVGIVREMETGMAAAAQFNF